MPHQQQIQMQHQLQHPQLLHQHHQPQLSHNSLPHPEQLDIPNSSQNSLSQRQQPSSSSNLVSSHPSAPSHPPHHQVLSHSSMDTTDFIKGHIKRESFNSLAQAPFPNNYYQPSPQQPSYMNHVPYTPNNNSVYEHSSYTGSVAPPLFTYPGMVVPGQNQNSLTGVLPSFPFQHLVTGQAPQQQQQQQQPLSHPVIEGKHHKKTLSEQFKRKAPISPYYSSSTGSTGSSIMSNPSMESYSTIGSEMDSIHLRKRPRKPDHAAPGDVCDQQLVEIAKQQLDVPIEELAMAIKVAEKNLAGMIGSNFRHTKDNRIAEAHKKRRHQIFAMVTLMRSVEEKENAVCPRNRIFNKYVQLCQDQNIPPVCNASFGKLVKVLYPSIKTRRLGIRGSSRYHYCGIKLIGDADDVDGFNSFTPTPKNGSPSAVGNISTNQGTGTTNVLSSTSTIDTSTSLANEITFEDYLFSHFTEKSLDFVAPSIEPYVSAFQPEDHVSLKLIEESYTDYCYRMFKCIRYMKIKSLFEEMSSFTLDFDTHSQELFVSPHLLPWILKCDQELYKSAIKLLSKIIFQNVPAHVRSQVSNIDSRFIDYTRQMNLPEHIIESKLRLAQLFINVVSRLTRVISTASTAVKSLSKLETRIQMMEEWKLIDFNRFVAREVRCNKKSDIKYLLENDIPALFQKLESLEEVEPNSSNEDDDNSADDNNNTAKSNENEQVSDLIIQTFTHALSKLPPRFHETDARLFLLVTNSLIDSILRQFTLADITSNFKPWWSFSCWINEFFGFIGELGGFIKSGSDSNDALIISNEPNEKQQHSHQQREEQDRQSKSNSGGSETFYLPAN